MAAHVAVIGSGGWSRVHLAALAAQPGIARITLVGRDGARVAARAAEFARVQATTAPWASVVADSSVDWVHVVLPHHLHVAVATAALEAGKDVICEKPAATRLVDFDRLRATAVRTGRRLLVVLNQLYNPVFARAREVLAAGAVGRPFLSVENAFSQHATHYRDPAAWRTHREEAGGGVLIDGGFHLVYRHLELLRPWGWPQWVVADAGQLNIDPGGRAVPDKGEDFVALTAGYPSGLRLHWAHGWTLAATPERWHQSFLAGSTATLEFTPRADEPLVLRRGTDSEPVTVPDGPRSGPETTGACLEDYIECLLTGRAPREGNLELVRRSLGLILAGYESAQLGRRVELD